MKNYETLIGIAEEEEKELHSVQEVAEFIYRNGMHGDVTILTEDGIPFITTFGIFLNKIADMEYREELLKVLIPLQTGEGNFEE